VTPRIAVVGSVNLDLVARVERLPRPGETVSGASFGRVPGGKGANQAVAAARLGAQVTFVGRVGDDSFAAEALVNLRELDLGVTVADAPTGVAVILVDASGENVIVVAPGANHELRPETVQLPEADAYLCQLEIPLETVRHVARTANGLFCLNAAPAQPGEVPVADLTIVNELELEQLGHRQNLVAVTLGAEGAILLRDGVEVARARPPRVDAVDGTAAGDAFCACLVVSILEERDLEECLRRACAAGALAASRHGAQPSLPTAAEVEAILLGA
jgi:ribokinase